MRLLRHMKNSWMICKVEAYISTAGTTGWVFPLHQCNLVNLYRQDLLPTCKALPKETTTSIWFTQCHTVCDGTTALQEVLNAVA